MTKNTTAHLLLLPLLLCACSPATNPKQHTPHEEYVMQCELLHYEYSVCNRFYWESIPLERLK